MMNRLSIASMAITLSAASIAAVQPKESTPEQKAARAERRINALNETGGFIADPREASGRYVFIDCGADIDASVLAAAAAKCQNSCMILTEVTNAIIRPFSFAAANETLRKSGGLMATFLIDEDAWPLEVICPEQRWAVVNVKMLKKDNPSKELFEARVRKMMSRSVGQVFQAGYAFSSISTMNLISTASDLDKIATEGLATECTTVIHATAEKFGYKPMKRVLYRKACMEGWAPPPVNAFQKSAWDKVHAMPTEPIKIKPETKKQDK